MRSLCEFRGRLDDVWSFVFAKDSVRAVGLRSMVGGTRGDEYLLQRLKEMKLQSATLQSVLKTPWKPKTIP